MPQMSRELTVQGTVQTTIWRVNGGVKGDAYVAVTSFELAQRRDKCCYVKTYHEVHSDEKNPSKR